MRKEVDIITGREDETMTGKDAYTEALRAWLKNPAEARPKKRPDGILTRNDLQWMTPAERAITDAMHAVEKAGASAALTAAVNLLSNARDRVADHVEDPGRPVPPHGSGP